jgi:hypothetical protein
MKAQIDSLETTEHQQLYTIIKKYTDTFTKTLNGVFVSTENLSSECLEEIEKYIQFCTDQNKRMEDDLRQRKTYERLVE